MSAARPNPVPGWSARQMATLTCLADAFAPGFGAEENARRARAAAELLNEVADPADLSQLRLVVTALEMPVVNWLTGSGWSRFSGLDAAARDRLLLGWANSRIGQRRTAFQAFKRLLLFLAYTDPGTTDAPNPAWTRMGYVAAAAVDAPPPSIRPLEVDRGSGDLLELEADVVVVGSGAGGGVVAARLTAAGRSVLVVEAGRYIPESSMPSLEGEGFRQLYLDQGTTATDDLAITIVAGSGAGGGTTVNWTTCIEPPDWLRDEWEAGGLDGFDSSQTDADLARLRSELGICDPTVVPPKDQAILDGSAALGWEAATTRRNAGPCTDCDTCGFGCRLGAKRSGLRAHLATAVAGGGRILVEAPVQRVLLNGGRAAGVEGRLTGGRPFRVHASQVVVAAGALRTPLILEASGVSHPALGRHLALHPAVVVVVFMPERVDMWRGPMQAARSLEFVQAGPASADGIGPAHHGFFMETGPAHPGLAASAFPWTGGVASSAMLDRAGWTIPLGAGQRDSGSGRVFRSRAGRPRISYRLTPEDRSTAARIMVEVSRLARAAGAQELLTASTPADRIDLRTASDAEWTAFLRRRATADYGPNRPFIFSAHQMGTARAGSDPGSSVCDPHGRVRASAGLFVADSSLFPTASGVNPMLTIMALAERTARAVLADG
jgi:choline dehydrogenase-like flavoprotein